LTYALLITWRIEINFSKKLSFRGVNHKGLIKFSGRGFCFNYFLYIYRPTGRYKTMKNTKEFIIQKAFGLFMTVGYNDVSMGRLLKETGISKGGFYHHFQSKEELFETVVEQFFFSVASDAGFQPHPEKNFLENMDDFLAQKEEAFRMFAQHLGVEHSEINFFMFIIQAIQHLPGVRQKVSLYMYREKQQIIRIVEIARQRGEIRTGINPVKVAGQIVAMFDGTEMHGVLMSESFETPSKEKEMIRQLFQWIKV
jgi:TetR/AcrR family transcriptional regulator, transcriptional repressor for nem operon